MSNLYKKPFKNAHIDVETVLPQGGSATLEWFYDEVDFNTIQKVQPGCGCTAKIDQLADRIRAVFTDQTVNDHFKGKDELSLTKTLTVFYKDGKPLKTKNNRGVEIWNPEKEQDVLTFSVKIRK